MLASAGFEPVLISNKPQEVGRVSDTTNIYEETPDMDKIATVNAWESDRTLPGSHRLNKLAGMLNVSISWLLHGVGTAPTEHDDRQRTVDKVTLQLEKLKLLHLETGHLIGQIQKELDSIGATH
jgi:transcriptional regulator with XRE-family HTH domain